MNPREALRALELKHAGLSRLQRLQHVVAARRQRLGPANAEMPVSLGPKGPLAGMTSTLLGPFPSPVWNEALRLRLLATPVWHQGPRRGTSYWSWRVLGPGDLVPGGGGGDDPAPDLEDDLAAERLAVLALVSELPFREGRARAEADVAGARTREELQELRELVLATLGHAPSPDAASEPAGAPNGSSRERHEAEVPSQSKADFGR